jgi:hypothetical protein
LVVAVLEDNILKDVTFNYQVDLSASATKLFLVRSFELKNDQLLFLLGRCDGIFTCSVTFAMISGGSERKVDIAVGEVQDPENNRFKLLCIQKIRWNTRNILAASKIRILLKTF